MEFLSLYEYLKQAKKIMMAEGYGHLVFNEDAVADVAHRMMFADQTWDATKSDRTTWRYNQAKYGIWKFLKKRSQDQKHVKISLDSPIYLKYNDKISLGSFVADVRSEDRSYQYDKICDVANRVLPPEEHKCFRLYYQDGVTLQGIADQQGCTRENVRQKLEHIKKKLKKCMSNQD
jgi:RNA polymerase sigma factor (sigma-70 family)